MKLKYCQPTKVPRCPAVGSLYQAREGKKRTWKHLKEVRRQLKARGTGPCTRNPTKYTWMDVYHAKSAHMEYQAMERGALKTIEALANEQGLTTKRELVTAD